MKMLGTTPEKRSVFKEDNVFDELQIVFEKLPLKEKNAEEIFEVLFSHEAYAFWLDSALNEDLNGKFSYMGSLSSLG
jgi:hypothetical protein